MPPLPLVLGWVFPILLNPYCTLRGCHASHARGRWVIFPGLCLEGHSMPGVSRLASSRAEFYIDLSALSPPLGHTYRTTSSSKRWTGNWPSGESCISTNSTSTVGGTGMCSSLWIQMGWGFHFYWAWELSIPSCKLMVKETLRMSSDVLVDANLSEVINHKAATPSLEVMQKGQLTFIGHSAIRFK